MSRRLSNLPLAKIVETTKLEAMVALRVGGRDRVGTVRICQLGHACSSTGRVGCSAELALGVLVHDPEVD